MVKVKLTKVEHGWSDEIMFRISEVDDKQTNLYCLYYMCQKDSSEFIPLTENNKNITFQIAKHPFKGSSKISIRKEGRQWRTHFVGNLRRDFCFPIYHHISEILGIEDEHYPSFHYRVIEVL